MSYAPSDTDLFRRAAAYVDSVLKGANPRDMPIVQPTKFELVMNLRTARTLGLDVPPALLTHADGVIDRTPSCCNALGPDVGTNRT